MRPRRLAGLRSRLFVLVLLALMPSLALSALGALEQRRTDAAEVQREALGVARLAAATQEQVVDGALHLLATLARIPAVRDRDTAVCDGILSDVLRGDPIYLNILATNGTGAVTCSGIPQPQRVGLGDRDYFVRLLGSGRPELSNYQISRTTGKDSIALAYPILDGTGEVQTVLVAALDLAWLSRLAAEAQLPSGATLTVVDRGSTVLARYPNPAQWVGRSFPEAPLVQAMRGREEGTIEAGGLDGVVRLYAFTPLRGAAGAGGGHVAVGIPSEVALADADQGFVRHLLGLLLAGALAFLAVWIGGGLFVVRPVRALVHATGRLRAGDLATRSGLRYDSGEVGTLARAFDEMAASLERLEAERRIQEQLRQEKERLEAENRRIEELSRLKSEFVNMVSHELRTPLTSIKGYLRLLEERATLLDDEQRSYLEVARSNADRLIVLIGDLLDVARIEAGKIELQRQPFDIRTAVWEVAQLLQPQIEAKQQVLRLELADDLPPVDGDPDRIAQILTNILSNAVKYTPPGGEVTIRVGAGVPHVRVEVADTGIGMSGEERAQLFTKFYRSTHPIVRGTAGTGLGLVITKAMVELHGGELFVTSAPGEGTSVAFTIPVRGDASRSTPPASVAAGT